MRQQSTRVTAVSSRILDAKSKSQDGAPVSGRSVVRDRSVRVLLISDNMGLITELDF